MKLRWSPNYGQSIGRYFGAWYVGVGLHKLKNWKVGLDVEISRNPYFSLSLFLPHICIGYEG